MTSSASRAHAGARGVSRVLTNAATDKDGNPSETLIKAKQERLDNWRTLQELAGIIWETWLRS